jgi:hypothetical protein
VQRHVEAERAHAGRLVADALQPQPEGRARERAEPQEHQHRDHERDEIARERVALRAADDARELDAVDAAEAREPRDLREEVEDQHAEGERDHQEVDPLAAGRDPAEAEPDQRRDHQRGHERDVWVPRCRHAAVGEHEVRVGHARDSVDPDLRERDHPAVGGEEDQARGRDSQPQRLRQDHVEEEVRHEQRRDRGETDDRRQHGPGQPPGRHRGVHAGLPNSPSGRTASTPTSSAKVTMIE